MLRYTEKRKYMYFIITRNKYNIYTHVIIIYIYCSFETRLLDIFNEVHQAYKQFDSRLKAEGFKARVMRMFRAWEDWAVYPRDFLVKLQNTFLGLVMVNINILSKLNIAS